MKRPKCEAYIMDCMELGCIWEIRQRINSMNGPQDFISIVDEFTIDDVPS